jgi:predicted dehydrogenase
MAVNLGEARAMVETCEQLGVRLAIHHQRRFLPPWAAARAQVAAGAIGKPTAILWQFGGGLLNIGSHAIDVSLFALGEPPVRWVIGQVERRTNRYERGVPAEDRCAAIIAVEGGARIVIESDLGDGAAGDQLLYGTEGTLRIGRQELHRLSPGAAGWEAVPTPAQPGFLDELLAWVEGGPEHRNAGRRALATHEVLMALYESARTRGIVHLPLQNTRSPLVQMIEDGTLASDEPPRDIRSQAALEYATGERASAQDQ